jgi:hypothetical protein
VFAGGASVSAGVLGLGWRVVVAMLLTGMVLIAVGWLAGRRNLARIDGLSDQLRTPTPRE